MSITKHWSQRYGATPAIVGADSLEFVLPQSVPEDDALDLAVKHYAFCPAIIEDKPDVTIRSYAESLMQSTIWHFWWY